MIYSSVDVYLYEWEHVATERFVNQVAFWLVSPHIPRLGIKPVDGKTIYLKYPGQLLKYFIEPVSLVQDLICAFPFHLIKSADFKQIQPSPALLTICCFSWEEEKD